jgi:hypothetical protein
VASYDIPIARPRRPATAFEPDFIAIVHALREKIRMELSSGAPDMAVQSSP